MESITTLLDELKDRIRNPIVWAFALAWISWNWEAVIILLSEFDEPAVKIVAIRSEFLDLYGDSLGTFATFVNAVLGPLAVSLTAVVLYPKLSYWFLEKNTEARVALNNMQNKVREKETVTQERYTAMKRQYEAELRQRDESVDAQNERIKDLAQQVSKSEQSHSELGTQLEKSSADLQLVSKERSDLQEATERLQTKNGKAQSEIDSLSKELESKDEQVTKLEVENKILREEKVQRGPGPKWIVEAMLEAASWQLVYNPSSGANKVMKFAPEGVIVRGKNEKEHTWRVSDNGHLEFINEAGHLQSRFKYDHEKELFMDTNAPDGVSRPKTTQDQYMERWPDEDLEA